MRRRRFLSQALATALSPFYAAGQTGTLRLRPMLQDLRPNAVTIQWLSLETGEARLDFACRSQAMRSVVSRSVSLEPEQTGLQFPLVHHQAELTGLDAASDYAYAIVTRGRPAGEFGFRTPGQSGPARMVILGDSGTDSPEQRRLAAMMTARTPELMLHTGDLAYPSGTVESYMERFFAPYAPMLERIPVFPCPGNHDYYHEQAKFYVALHAVPRTGVPPEGHGRYYSFDWDNAHIVVLDSNTPLEEAVRGQGAMLEWLDRDLAATRQFWRIAMFHHPPFAGGPNQDDPLSHLARQWIVPILEKHGVQVVLSGHEHNYQRSRPVRNGRVVAAEEGIVYLTTGGGGASLYEPIPRPEAAFQQSCFHFLEARIDGVRFHSQAIRVDGAVIDEVPVTPVPRPASLTNAASSMPTVAPGGLCVIRGRQFAPRDGDLAGIQVRVSGVRAQVVAAGSDHATFVMPETARGETALTVANANGEAAMPVHVLESAPAIFMIERAGTRIGALFHADGEPVEDRRPARTGEELTVYLTGTGGHRTLMVETAEATAEAGCQPVAGQPGVEVARFRVPQGAGSSLRLRAGVFLSNEIPLWVS